MVMSFKNLEVYFINIFQHRKKECLECIGKEMLVCVAISLREHKTLYNTAIVFAIEV